MKRITVSETTWHRLRKISWKGTLSMADVNVVNGKYTCAINDETYARIERLREDGETLEAFINRIVSLYINQQEQHLRQ